MSTVSFQRVRQGQWFLTVENPEKNYDYPYRLQIMFNFKYFV